MRYDAKDDMSNREMVDAIEKLFGGIVASMAMPQPVRVSIKGSALKRALSAQLEVASRVRQEAEGAARTLGLPALQRGPLVPTVEAERLFIDHLEEERTYALTLSELRGLFAGHSAGCIV